MNLKKWYSLFSFAYPHVFGGYVKVWEDDVHKFQLIIKNPRTKSLPKTKTTFWTVFLSAIKKPLKVKIKVNATQKWILILSNVSWT